MSNFWPAKESDAMLQFIDEICGLQIRSDQLGTTTQLLERRMRQLECRDIAQLKAALRRDPQALESLIDDLTVGETYFFREPKHFRFVSEVVLPTARVRLNGSRPIRLWSAACASGEEAYSLAMVCARLGDHKDTRILGTDISQAAINKARQGRYREWSFRGDALAQAAGLVERQSDALVVNQELRERVTFRKLHLVADDLPSIVGGRESQDLILCRNVFIYFSSETVASVAERLVECLAVGGWLITASADPPLTACPGLEVVSTDLGIFYRRAKTALGPRPETEPLRLGSRTRPVTDTARPVSGNDEHRAGQGAPPAPCTAGGEALLAGRPRLGLSEPRQERSVSGGQGALTQALAAAQLALASGDFPRAIAVTEPLLDHLEACILNLQAHTQLDAQAALLRFPEAFQRHALSPALHYLYAVLLLDTGRIDEAYKSVQKSVFLDRSLAMPHFLLGSIQQQRGQLDAAWRHYRNARDLCRQLPPETLVPFTEGGSAAELGRAAEEHMNRIGTRPE